jgi:hypothetical protein
MIRRKILIITVFVAGRSAEKKRSSRVFGKPESCKGDFRSWWERKMVSRASKKTFFSGTCRRE